MKKQTYDFTGGGDVGAQCSLPLAGPLARIQGGAGKHVLPCPSPGGNMTGGVESNVRPRYHTVLRREKRKSGDRRARGRSLSLRAPCGVQFLTAAPDEIGA